MNRIVILVATVLTAAALPLIGAEPSPSQSSPDPKACHNIVPPPEDFCPLLSSGSSYSRVNYVAIIHIQDAIDYQYAPQGGSAPGCSTCGGGARDALATTGQLPRLQFKREHSYRYVTQHSSLGPGVFFADYDVSLELSSIGQSWTNFGKNSVRVIDPCKFENSTNTYDYNWYQGIDLSTSQFVLSRLDATVDFNWGAGSPDLIVPRDNFGARWTGSVTIPTDGTYTFYTQSDDGVRLWIDGQAVVNNWTDHGTTENSGTRTLTTGAHTVALEYYEKGGGAVCKLLWAGPGISKQTIPASALTPSSGTGEGLTGSYYAIDPKQLAFSRVDATVDFTWGGGSPDILVSNDRFAATWNGTVTAPVDGSYLFHTISDDGLRLWVNNQLLIDRWSDHSATEDTGTITLVAGQSYAIRVDYDENGGDATCRLLWTPPGQTKVVIPATALTPVGGVGQGLTGTYYTSSPLITRVESALDVDWGKHSPDPSLQPDNFKARWTGFVTPLADDAYTFFARADDGVRLWIDGTLLIDQWKDQGATEYSATVTLTGGQPHAVRMDYYENAGSATARLSWSSSTITKQVVPSSVLTQESGSGQGLTARYTGMTTIMRGADGIYYDDDPYGGRSTRSIGEVRLLNAADALTADQSYAVKAIMTSREGTVSTFEIFRTDPDPLTTERFGRLVSIADRNGNTQVITYRYAVTTDAVQSGGDLAKLWMIDHITDAYGQQAAFTYQATQVAGRWVVSRIDLPNGQHLSYQYNNTGAPNTPANLVGLSGVDLPAGDHVSITASYDPATQAQVVTYDDPAAEGTHRRKTLYLTGTSYVDGTGATIGLASGRLRAIVNGAGETSYLARNWSRPDGLQATLIYLGGNEMMAVVHAGGSYSGRIKRYERAVTWDLTTDPSTWTWEPTVVDIGTDTWYRITSTTDNAGRKTSYDIDPVTAKNRKTTYPDASTSTTTWNQFSQPLLDIDRLGRRTEYTYDAKGNLLQKVAAAGTPEASTWKWAYSANGLLLHAYDADYSASSADLHVTDYFYDANNLLVGRLDSADQAGGPRSLWQFSYDAFGRLLTTTDPVGRTVTYTYDGRNRVTDLAYADGSHETYTYGTGINANLLVAKTDRNGNRTVVTYDGHGRLIEQTVAGPTAGDPVIGSQSFAYLTGTNDRVTSRTSDGDTTTTVFDHLNRAIAQTQRPTAATTLITTTTYDSVGRAIVRTDAYGRRSFPVFDVNDRTIRTVQELVNGGYTGATDQATLAALARPAGVNPGYRIEDRTYDSEGQQLTRTDGRGITHATAYDAQGRLVAQVEGDRIPSGATTVPAPEAGQTRFEYDRQGNRTAVIMPRSFQRLADGSFVPGQSGEFRTSFGYTGRNLLATRVTANGLDQNNVARPERAVTTQTFSPTGKVATMTDPRLKVTTYEYGTCCDRLTRTTDAEGGVTQYAYDPVGNVRTITDGNGLVTTTTYDARQRVTTVTNGASETTTYTYDDNGADGIGLSGTFVTAFGGLGLGAGADGSAILVTNPLGQTTLGIRDGLGRVVKTVDGNGFARVTTHDGLLDGLVVTTQIDPLGHATSARTDALGSVRVSVDALSQVTLAAFDANGNRVSIRDPNGIGQDCVYDSRNRDITCTDTVGAVTAKIFDAHGNVVTTTDALGHVTTCTFDGNDRKVSCKDRIAATTVFQFDLSSNLTKITDAEGGVTDYAYDGRNLLVSETYPTGQQGRTGRTYTYDPGRRLTSRTVTTVGGPAFSEATGYQYDGANRLTVRSYADGLSDVFGYDHASRLTSARSNRYANTVARSYDSGGRLTAEIMTIDAGAIAGTGAGATVTATTTTVGYSYDAANRTQTITYPDGTVATRSYTDRNQFKGVSFAGSTIANRQYDAGGRLTTTTLGNGLSETRTYVAGDNLVASIAVPNVTGFVYTYDANKRKTTEVDNLQASANQAFSYDHQDRLTAWNRAMIDSQDFSLTPVGDFSAVTRNGVAETRTHTAVHETTGITSPAGTVALEYDAKGNLTLDEQGTAMAWDQENRLASAQAKPNTTLSWWGAVSRYAYDALGRRIEKVVQGRATRFIHDGAQVILESEQAAVPSASDLAGDGSAANAAQPPASGGILPGTDITRINFQPPSSIVPQGYLADKGRVFGIRTNGKTYGWASDATGNAVDRGQVVPLIEFDTFIAMQPSGGSSNTWSVALPDGSYPVIVVCGDAQSTNQTNDLLIGNQTVVDPTPASSPSYEQGNFDGYAVQVTVTGGTLVISPGTGAFNAKICFLEIGKKDQVIDQATRDKLADLIQRAKSQTGAPPPDAESSKKYVYGSYVDEPLAIVSDSGGSTQTGYVHGNSLYSVSTLTNNSGAIIERYRYDAYGQRTVLAADGVTTRTGSLYGNQVGFTGRYLDRETGLWYFRARHYSGSLGRFTGRDPVRYKDGYALYGAYFIPNARDPHGLWKKRHDHVWEAEDGDWLSKLAAKSEYGGDAKNWSCLWPVEGTQDHGYPNIIKKCDKYDAKNLAVPAPDANRDIRYDISRDTRHQGLPFAPPSAIPGAIRTSSGQGKTPISYMLLIGHGNPGMMGGNMTSAGFDRNDGNLSMRELNALEDPAPTFVRAQDMKGPKRCWFSRDAEVRLGGCNTSGFAREFARALLRPGATAYGTNSFFGIASDWSGIQYSDDLNNFSDGPTSSNIWDPAVWVPHGGSL